MPAIHPYTSNKLKAVRYEQPEWTPCQVNFLPRTWMTYREALEEVVLAHPRLFPGYVKGSKDFDAVEDPLYEIGQRTDCWGTTWKNVLRGLDSHPVAYPLLDWKDLESYSPPDPLRNSLIGPQDWEAVRRQMEEARANGRLAVGVLPHGFMYMRLFYLRGFENLMVDFANGDPRLYPLIKMVEDYNIAVIKQLLHTGAELMVFGDDLGMQNALPVSPRMWRKYLKPSFKRMFSLCHEAGALVFLHTDGHILEIIPDLVEAGVDLLNPQYRANGLENLRELLRGQLAGKFAMELDLDRQLFPFANPAELEAHVVETHEVLYDPQGGLLLSAEFSPDVPLENIAAVCTALENTCWQNPKI